MQHAPNQEPSQNIEMSLREHLLAAGQAPPPYPPSSMPQSGPDHHYQGSDSVSPHHEHLDPNVTGGPMPYGMSGDTGDEGTSPDARKGKRELSTSKRAAQNRAAQRAFRQRKEGYIKKLEEQVKEFQNMEQSYKALQNENFQLREYILNLQSRLLENQSDFPPAPSHINLSSSNQPPTGNASEASYAAEQQLRREMQQQRPLQHVTAREDAVRHDGISQLHAAATQAGAGSSYGMSGEHPNKRARTDDLGKDK